MFGRLFKLWWRDRPRPNVAALDRSVAAGGDIVDSTITFGLDESRTRQMFREELERIAHVKGVPEPPLRAVLDKLGQAGVPASEIPARLDAAADELIRLRADLARLRNDRPEFAVIRSRAAAFIDKGDFDAARGVLQEGRETARLLREELGRSEAAFLADEARVDRLQLNYESAVAKFTEAADLDPDECWIWIELGDLWILRGHLASAEAAYRRAVQAAGKQGDERDLSVSYNKIGDVQREQGDLAAALNSYKASQAIFERLAKADPGNAGWQRDLSVSYNRIGDVQSAQGDLAAALNSYKADLSIAERLAKADPGNAGWQRDLSVSYNRIGDVQRAQGDLAAALSSYKASQAIRERLAKADPGNAGWQRDLSVSYDRIGDVQREQGDLAAALNSYKASHAIFERLAKADPGNAGWQRDLSVSLGRLGLIYAGMGERENAVVAFRQGRAIITRLMTISPDNAILPRDLVWFDSEIAQVKAP